MLLKIHVYSQSKEQPLDLHLVNDFKTKLINSEFEAEDIILFNFAISNIGVYPFYKTRIYDELNKQILINAEN